MDTFPALTIIAHVETKKEMDLFGPSSQRREEDDLASLQRMLATGKNSDGKPLTADDRTQVQSAVAERKEVIGELTGVKFQSATMTFDHDFAVDIGGREVQVKYLGRGNTGGDAVAYLPKEKVAIVGDLVVYPIPFIYDGYPSECVHTLDNVAQLDARTIVPGHGPVMHDKSHVLLIRDLLQSAVDQMNTKLGQTRPAMFQTLDDVKGGVDLKPFRQRFAGTDAGLGAEFDDMAANLVKVVFEEASLH
jgi:glyoxylase-like metal-dependent hydrolase (beta-lactamase superfamily II)